MCLFIILIIIIGILFILFFIPSFILFSFNLYLLKRFSFISISIIVIFLIVGIISPINFFNKVYLFYFYKRRFFLDLKTNLAFSILDHHFLLEKSHFIMFFFISCLFFILIFYTFDIDKKEKKILKEFYIFLFIIELIAFLVLSIDDSEIIKKRKIWKGEEDSVRRYF